MTGIDDELRRCFRAAFPEVPERQLPSASTDTLAEWDSLRALLLMALLEEAFGIRIPTREYPNLRSYASVHMYLCRIRAQE